MKILQRTYIALLLAVFAFAMLIPPTVVRAAILETVEDHMNRQVQNQTSGVSHEIVFTVPAGNSGTEAEVHLIFPSADNGLWCQTAGAITVAGSTTYAANALPGTLAATCAGTPDTLTITGVTNLSASTEYGVLLTDSGAGSLGTPTTGTDGVITVQTRDSGQTLIDEEQLAVDIIADDQVVVSADVDPTITVVLSANSINLGTLSTSQVNQDGITSTVTTNSSNGYSSQVLYDVTLTSGSNTISDTTGGNIVAGTEEFGASSSDSGNDIGIWSPTACADTGSTSNADALTTSLQTFASNTVAVSSEATTLCFLASIAGTTESGTYSNTVTVVTTGLF